MKAIVYLSNTGFTERYATMLSEKLSLPAYSLPVAMKTLGKGDEVIYMGWLFAGSVKGYKKARRRFLVKGLVAVGLAETGTLVSSVKHSNRVPDETKVFNVQGGIKHSSLRGINKFMMDSLVKFMSKAKCETEEDEKKLALIKNDGDYVSEENLTEIGDWFWKGEKQ